MEKRILTICTASMLGLALSLSGCTNAAGEEETVFNVEEQSVWFDNTGEGEKLITVESNCDWEAAADDPSWIDIEKINSATLKISVRPNLLEGGQREGTVSIIPEKGDAVPVTVTQDAGYTLNGKWQVLWQDVSTDLEYWKTGENYINMGIELYYIFDLENGSVIMSDSELGDMTFTLSAYDPENMTFTITDGTSEGIYTIYSINNSQLEFYSFFDFSQEYIRPHCERVE
ncbi:MAG TPA: BACON domain-containing protein [Candidatus Coprenecus stercoripullorum]|nr:BACON domain-containing protein [Candidatus Coprenecus stercoripullorum]